MIPLISSLCYGPLEVCQLPRTWWKVLLRNAGILDEEYPDVSEGLDKSVLEVLNLDRSKTLAYLLEDMPGYLQFEAWVLGQNDGTLDRQAIENWNDTVRNRVHTRPDKLEETTSDIGIPNDGAITSAVILNSLQDWMLFYRRDLAGGFSSLRGTRGSPRLQPGLRSSQRLPTPSYVAEDIAQVPEPASPGLSRYDRRRTGPPRPARRQHPAGRRRTIHMRQCAHLSRLRSLDSSTKRRTNRPRRRRRDWNSFVRTRIHTEEKIVDIHNTLGLANDGSLTSAVVLNHVEDWHFAHADLTGNTAGST